MSMIAHRLWQVPVRVRHILDPLDRKMLQLATLLPKIAVAQRKVI